MICEDIGIDVDGIYVKSITERIFIYSMNSILYLADSLKDIDSNCSLTIESDAVNFYKKFNFIYPPFTQYRGVYLMVPLLKFSINERGVSFPKLDLEKKVRSKVDHKLDIESDIKKSLSKQLNSGNYSILVSGGIDSSVLLGWGSDNSVIKSAYMCNMSSIPNESLVAQKQCDSKSIELTLFDLDMDLTHRAEQFINETGEMIADPISVVFPELFSRLYTQHNTESIYLIDGQGADSLFNGLPHNKLYKFWTLFRPVSIVFRPLKWLPAYTDRSTSYKRLIYRAVKVFKSLAFSSFAESLVFSLIVEDTKNKSELEEYFEKEIVEIYNVLKDWDAVIRYIFLFRILPAREMQKYLLAEKYNIKIIAPFIDKNFIEQFIDLDRKYTVQNNIYKYPLTKLANEYWPSLFKKSKTSPFQVNFTLKTNSLSKFSLERLI